SIQLDIYTAASEEESSYK
ncbi:hypothetical protein Tco_1560667, partial [Tanacetum coccineum]